MNMNLPGLQASLQAGAHAGQVDRVTVDPHSDSIGYRTTASSTTLGGTLLSSPGAVAGARTSASARSGLSDRLVQFQTATSRGGGEQLSFPAGRELVIHHAGAPANVSLTLSAFGASGQPIAVQLPPLRLLRGATLHVDPGNWRALGSSPVRIRTTVHGRTTTRRVRGRTIGRRFATVRHAALVSLGQGRYRIDLLLGVRHAPRQAWLSVASTVLRGRHVIEQARPIQLTGSMLSAGKARLILPKPLSPGRYSLRIRLLEVTANGPVQGSQIVSRKLSVRAVKR